MNIPTIEELRKMENFCPLPWVSLFTKFEGEILACCVDWGTPLGFYNEKDCWNSEKIKQLRLDMLNNIYNERCCFCIKSQDPKNIRSVRVSSIHDYLNEDTYNTIKQTKEDGTLDISPLVLDTKFSNLCNLKCLKCNEYNNGGNLQVDNNYLDSFFENNFELIKNIKRIIIAGGEPFLMKQHKYFLELLIKNNLTDKYIEYFTNFTIDVEPYFEYWKHFKRICLISSLDEQKERFEYIRFNGKWNNVLSNKNKIDKYIKGYGNLKFIIQPTIDIFNIYNFPLTLKEWMLNEFITINSIILNLVGDIKELTFENLPTNYLKECLDNFLELEKYNNISINEFIKTLKIFIKNDNFDEDNLKNSISFINNSFVKFKEKNNNFNSIFDIFPEFKKFM